MILPRSSARSMNYTCIAWRCIVLLPLGMILLVGCSENAGPERVVVSGTVSYNGQPIPKGMISFVPGPNCSAPTSGATIVDGWYKADAKGGVPVGTHTIQMEAYRQPANSGDPAEQSGPTPTRGEPREQYLPEKFNVRSTWQFTVSAGSRAIRKDLDLTD